MRAPRFWRHDAAPLVPALLSPFSRLTAAATARRVSRPGWRASVPVLCCGNVTVGGSGKTTLALDLLRRLTERGAAPHALLRGYGGAARGVRRVLPDDDAAETGDEAQLLARLAPTWTGADRAAAARAAVAAGAGALVLDDGLQNATLRKDASLLVIDGGFGFGNGRVLPAGPLREPVAAGAARCRAAVLIGDDQAGAAAALPPALPVLRARLVPGPATMTLRGRRVLAFAGIGRPEKFFATLREAGAELVGGVPFADHHRFAARELDALVRDAQRLGAVLTTTAKDAVRLPPAVRDAVFVADVVLDWETPEEIEAILDEIVGLRRR